MRRHLFSLGLIAVVLAGLTTSLPGQSPGTDTRSGVERLPAPRSNGTVPIYRLVNASTGDHVFALSANEVAMLQHQGTHRYEGVGFQVFAAAQPGTRPLYRFVLPDGRHLLDTRSATPDPSARLEFTLGHVANAAGSGLVPLHAWIHPQNGLFFFTTDARGELAPALGYRYEGVLGNVIPANT